MKEAKILCVDDEQNVLSAIKRLFTMEGYEVMTAQSVEEALQEISARTPQVILADYKMPGTNGVVLFKRSMEICPDAMRILLTGYSDLGVVMEAINEGAVYKFITKPWDDMELLVTVRRALEHHVSIQQNRAFVEHLEEMVEERTRVVQETLRRLAKAQQQLVRSERLAVVGQLAAGITHEVANPMSVILGYAELLQISEDPDPKVAKAARIIQEQGERVVEIAQGLLNFSRQRLPEHHPVALNDVLQKTLFLLDYEFKRSEVQVEAEFQPDLPPVLADGDQLSQVFMNLITNAIHAMQGGGRLALVSRQAVTPEGQEAVEVRLEDTGCGISKPDLSKIFDPFFTTKPEGEGTGLGLSISYGIVEAHGGTIDVESEVGQGTRFTIRLPLGEARESTPVRSRSDL